MNSASSPFLALAHLESSRQSTALQAAHEHRQTESWRSASTALHTFQLLDILCITKKKKIKIKSTIISKSEQLMLRFYSKPTYEIKQRLCLLSLCWLTNQLSIHSFRCLSFPHFSHCIFAHDYSLFTHCCKVVDLSLTKHTLAAKERKQRAAVSEVRRLSQHSCHTD